MYILIVNEKEELYLLLSLNKKDRKKRNKNVVDIFIFKHFLMI
jgi:hypothetical protein